GRCGYLFSPQGGRRLLAGNALPEDVPRPALTAASLDSHTSRVWARKRRGSPRLRGPSDSDPAPALSGPWPLRYMLIFESRLTICRRKAILQAVCRIWSTKRMKVSRE